ncbi:hypothetical protein NicSoilC5_04720 [Arthrobacter sp. NicSoilC5]|nr:hypothetical protein NicSoilC5_04720 [Arthrobacter sp. NicSoilC5]
MSFFMAASISAWDTGEEGPPDAGDVPPPQAVRALTLSAAKGNAARMERREISRDMTSAFYWEGDVGAAARP